jgi:hypothetical protein
MICRDNVSILWAERQCCHIITTQHIMKFTAQRMRQAHKRAKEVRQWTDCHYHQALSYALTEFRVKVTDKATATQGHVVYLTLDPYSDYDRPTMRTRSKNRRHASKRRQTSYMQSGIRGRQVERYQTAEQYTPEELRKLRING